MKTQTPLPLQPKWICAAAIGALTMGAIVGANAADTDGDLPAPPTVSGQMPMPGGPGADGAGPGQDDGPPGMGPQDGGPGQGGPGMGGPQGRGPQQQGGRQGAPRARQGMNGGRPGGRGQGGQQGPGGQDEMGPPDPMGEDGMGGPGMGGPGRGGRAMGGFGQGQGGPGGGQGMGGPRQGGPGGPGRGGPRGADMDTADGAAQALDRAYHDGGDVEAAGKLKGDAQNLQSQAKDYYNKAIEAYKAKNYDKSSALADVSSHLSKAVLVLTQNDGPKGPSGWAAPPVLTSAPKDRDQNRAAMTLNRTYRELGHPLETKDTIGQQWFNTAKTYYKTASAGYTAKNYDTAQSYAAAADEVIQAAHAVGDSADL
jgi:HEPN domain-containing protein